MNDTALPARLNDGNLRRQVRRMGTVALFFIAFFLSLGTYVAYTNSKQPLGPKPQTVAILIVGNLAVLIVLASIVARRVGKLWRALKRGSVGSRLQTRIVLTFSLVTIIPTLMISLFSVVLFQYGIKTWFDTRVATALHESVAVAEAYLEEHKETLRADTAAMSGDLQRDLQSAIINPPAFANVLNNQVLLRNLNEAVVIQNRRVLARSHLSFSLMFETLPENVIERARRGEIALVDEGDRIMAVAQLDPVNETYLLTTRLVDPKVIAHTDQAHGAVEQYEHLQQQIGRLQFQFTIVFVLVALLLLLSVIWYGLLFATRLIVPLSRLINATERVRAGDYSMKLEVGKGDDELTTLTRRFNRMTTQLRTQRDDITQANRLLDERRRFSETVLAGVSAGIIALDAEQKVRLLNRTAQHYLQLQEDGEYEGRTLASLVPALTGLLQNARATPTERHREDIQLAQETRTLTLHTRVTAEMQGPNVAGYIVTFDDISPLVTAQRRAAWSDVARRVAHEIKNPLTPIQLSAERLRKKFAPGAPEEKETFNRYIDTILRHLGDIGHMVEEFVSFARLPTPQPKTVALLPLIQKAAFSAETAYRLSIDVQAAQQDVTMICDEGQIHQVMTNLLKNAAEGIERRPDENAATGRIEIDLRVVEEKIVLTVCDNGVGLPADKLDTLTEPYVTTREKGTGLGLAIVKKIVEDHKGVLGLSNRAEGGACVTLTFPLERNG